MSHNVWDSIRPNIVKPHNGNSFFPHYQYFEHDFECKQRKLDLISLELIVSVSYFFLSRTIYDNERGESIGESIVQSNAEKYRMCERFSFKCMVCKAENIIAKPFVKIGNSYEPVLKQCLNQNCSADLFYQVESIQNQLSLAIRKTIRTYYDNWLICDDPNCNQSTRTFVHVSIIFILLC